MTTPISYPNRAAALRAKLLGQSTPPNKEIVIDGEKYFCRSPLLDDRQKVLDLAGMKFKQPKKKKKGDDDDDDEIKVPLDAMMAAAAVTLAVDENGNQIFEHADFETIRKAPVGGWLERLSRACLHHLQGGDDEGEE